VVGGGEGVAGGRGVGPLICGSAQIACRNLAPVGTALKDPFLSKNRQHKE